MKKTLLLALFATACSFAQSITTSAPAFFNNEVKPLDAAGSIVEAGVTISYADLPSLNTVFLEIKIGGESGTVISAANFVPESPTGSVDVNFGFPSPQPVGGDVVTIVVNQFGPAVSATSVDVTIAPYIIMVPPTETDVSFTGETDFTVNYLVFNTATIFCEAKISGTAVGGRNISPTIVGEAQTISWPNLNDFDAPAPDPMAGDMVDWQGAQFGGTGAVLAAIASFTIVSNLSGEAFYRPGIKGYPIPVKDVLNIADYNTATSFRVVDMLGKTVMQEIPASRRIDLSSLKQGVYFLVSNLNGTLRLVKL